MVRHSPLVRPRTRSSREPQTLIPRRVRRRTQRLNTCRVNQPARGSAARWSSCLPCEIREQRSRLEQCCRLHRDCVKSTALAFVACCSRPAILADGDQSSSRSARARARAEFTEQIKQAARRQLAEPGSAGLSCARWLGVGHGVLGGLPLLPEPGRAAHRADRRRLHRPRPGRPPPRPAIRRPDLAGRWLATAGPPVGGRSSIRTSTRSSSAARCRLPGADRDHRPGRPIPLLLLAILAGAAAAGRGPGGHDPIPRPCTRSETAARALRPVCPTDTSPGR